MVGIRCQAGRRLDPGVLAQDVFLRHVSGIFVGQIVVAGDGAICGNQDCHEDHFGPFNSVGRLCLDVARAWVASMVGIVIFENSEFSFRHRESG